MNNKILIITGMHRSGTSVISHWLNSCGLNLGEQLLGGGIGNAEGHFEDIDFYRFHEDTLQANNLPPTGLTTVKVPTLSDYQHGKLKSLIGFKNKRSRQWGWKEPRTCLFLEHYRELIPDAYYLNIIRDYKAVVNSLVSREFKIYEGKYAKRNSLSQFYWENIRRERTKAKFYRELSEFYLKVWICYNEELLKNIHKLPVDKYMVIDYVSLLDYDKNIFHQLESDWHFDLQYYEFKKIFKENLISQSEDIDLYVNDKDLLKKAAELEKKLKRMCTIKPVLPKEKLLLKN